jgi:Tol biopolymer transport system component
LFTPDAGSARPETQIAALHDIQQPQDDLDVARIVFSRGDFIYMKDLQSGKQTKLIRAYWGETSPDGSKLLFRLAADEELDAPMPPLQLLELGTGRVQELSSINHLHPLDAYWSNDGTKIAFEGPYTAFSLLNPATGEWRTITTAQRLQTDRYESHYTLTSWSPDDKSILIQSLEYLYQVTLDGEVIWKLPISDFNISSATRFSLSSDKKLLLFDNYQEGGEHHPVNGVVSILEIASGKMRTITPGTIFAREPRWFGSDNKILFTCLERPKGPPFQPHLCTINVDGSGLTRLIDNADNASVSFDQKLTQSRIGRAIR